MEKSYKSTVFASYTGSFIQAIVVNVTPILFVPLKELFGLTYTQFGVLVLANFITQVCVDIAFSKAVDRYGFRPFIVTAHVLCASGLALFACAPLLFPTNIYGGLLLGTIVFSGAGGLFELLLSPIIDAIPSKEKEKAMALLHSFYAWGQVAVVVVTTLCVFIGIAWWVIVLCWAIIPLCNAFVFSRVPLAQKHLEGSAMGIRKLLQSRIFLLAFCCILFGAAAEMIMAQWASSFLEKGIALPKIAGDMLGMCGFAVMLGIGRVVYGIKSASMNLERVLFVGAALATVCYLTVSLSPLPWLSVLACCICGLCVSLLWPGTLILASSKLPLAGASMFALLAAGGDIGASIGPWFTGIIADAATALPPVFSLTPEQLGLRVSIFVAAIFPMCAMIFLHRLTRQRAEEEKTSTQAQNV